MDTLEDFNDQAAHKLGNILLKGKILQPLSLGGLLGHTAMPEHRGEGLQLQDRSVNPELPCAYTRGSGSLHQIKAMLGNRTPPKSGRPEGEIFCFPMCM